MRSSVILVAGFVALGASGAFAEPLRPVFGGVLPPAEVNAIVRSMGLIPVGRPSREGLAYAVLAADPRGGQLRVIVDARFGDVLSVRRILAGPPGAVPEPRAYGVVPRPYGPYEPPWMGPDFRPPGSIGRADPRRPDLPAPRPRPAAPVDKPEEKSVGAPPSPRAAVVTIGRSAASRAADPAPTGSTAPSFPPAQTLE